MNQRRWALGGGALLAAVAVGGAALVVGRNSAPALMRDKTTTPAESSPTTTAPAGFTEFRDEESGIAVSHPTPWQRVTSPDPQVRLIVAANDHDSLLLRTVRLDHPVTAAELPAMQQLTTSIVSAGTEIQVVSGPKPLDVGGLPGYHYLYTFKDQVGGGRGVHSHYFLFKHDLMISMVFQAIPQGAFEELAPVFDTIASTLRVTNADQSDDKATPTTPTSSR